ncbi:uncharacterized protein LOC132551801 [Ylistrum balloti]|uniref:uncharacterized protein LOC132551801 n=1 Tax=Ylistrum balloti TaxID=509963 RepID=UPI002905EE1C|nr:uncharacterized protein LOC132551801 [Ylistrum balloti]
MGVRRLRFTQIGGVSLLILVLLYQSTFISCANLSSFRALFVRMPQMHLSTIPVKTIRNSSVEACAELCVREVEFECMSFDLDNTIGSCRLQNHTHEEPFVTLQVSTFADHYRTAYEKLFNRIPNHVVTFEHKRKIPDLTVEDCARRCILEVNFRCQGFDYEVRQRNCWLSDLTPKDSGGVIILPGTDFYERISNGPMEKFVNFGYGTLQQIEGIQVYNKIILGVTLDACAQLCLAETSFRCYSFDYVFNDDSCHMSQYIAANVHGVSTSFSEDFKSMHFELKEEYLEMFYPTPYSAVLGNNEKTFKRVTPNNCARKCLQESDFVCRSFDYQIQDGTCLLGTKTGSDVGGLISHGFAQVHHFEMKPFLDCGGVFYASEGNFASPNWPRNYYHNMECSWQITVPKFRIIKLEFSHFDLGRHDNDECEEADDKLVIIDKADVDLDHRRKVMCSVPKQSSYISLSNSLNVTFISNAFQDAMGFRVFFHTDWPCGGTLTEDNGMISSPNWPNNYAPSTSCQWKIVAPKGAKIYLNFLSMDLERHMNGPCRLAYDLIEVFDGDSDSSPTLGIYCGRRNKKTVTSSNDVLFITFHTDDRVQRKGFHAVYKFIHIPTPTTSIPSSIDQTTSHPSSQETSASVDSSQETTGHYNVSYNTTPSSSVSENNKTVITLGLAAMFIEPRRRPSPTEKSVEEALIVTTETGEKFDDYDVTHEIPEVVTIEPDLRHVILILVITFFVLFMTLLVILIVVCRHYRKRIPKRRNVTNFPFTEESVSLYDKDNNANDQADRGQDDDSDINLPQPSPCDPPPDVTFCNPLYEQRTSQSVTAQTNTESTESNSSTC